MKKPDFKFFKNSYGIDWENSGLLYGIEPVDRIILEHLLDETMGLLLNDHELPLSHPIGILMLPIVRRSYNHINLNSLPQIYIQFKTFFHEYYNQYIGHFENVDGEALFAQDFSEMICGNLSEEDIQQKFRSPQ